MYNSFSDSELTAHYRMFSNIAAERDTVTLDELARRSGLPYQTVLRDLQRILQRSWFGDGAYINYLSKTLVIRVPEAGAATERTAAPVGGANADGTYHYSFRAQPLNTMRASERMGQTPAGTSRSYASRARSGAAAAAAGKNLPAVTSKDKKWKRILLGAGIVCALVAFGNITDAVDTLSWGGFSLFVEDFLNALLWGGLSAGSFIGRSLLSRRERRMRSYITIQAGRAAVPIRELADANDVTVDRAKRDLEKMIDEGQWGPGAYIDASTDTLYLNYTQPQARPQAAAQPAPRPEVRQEPAAPAQPQQAQQKTEQKKGGEYEEILQEIRTLNDNIADPVVSQKISQIEDVTAKIFRIVAEKPEKKSEIKSFMSYYLPTTLKLLRSYSTFEKQGVAGENIDNAKKDIERILDTLVVGFTQQLDQLFQTEALDISSDIEVLEQMMKKDGLSETDDFGGVAMGGV